MIPCFDLIHPDEVALPDRLFFGDDTLERSREAYKFYRKHSPSIQLMGIPQGRTEKEFFECFKGLLGLGIETIGISKDYEVWSGGLLSIVEMVVNYTERMKLNTNIHLLGWARNLDAPGHVERELPGEVRSIDTAKAIVFAMSNMILPKISRNMQIRYPMRPRDYLEAEMTEDQECIAIKNILTLRNSIGDI